VTLPHPQNEVRTIGLCLLGKLAPEAHLSAVNSDVSVRDRQDTDSRGFLNSVIALHQWRLPLSRTYKLM